MWVGNRTVEIIIPVPLPYLINYHNVPLYMIIATAVAPRCTLVRNNAHRGWYYILYLHRDTPYIHNTNSSRRAVYVPRNYPRITAVHRRVYMREKVLAVFIASIQLYTIDRIYKYTRLNIWWAILFFNKILRIDKIYTYITSVVI